MKCFLHIGTPKTATTTLQDFLKINRAPLLERGVFFPGAAGASGHRTLAVAAYGPQRRDEFTRRKGLDSPEQLRAFQRQVIQRLRLELKGQRMATPDVALVLSCEHFHSRLQEDLEVKRLRRMLMNQGVTEFKVIVYLRRPAEAVNSLFSTAIRGGGTAVAPPRVDQPNFRNLCDHQATLERWGGVFGESAMVPRLFDKQEFVNGSIIDDLLAILGLVNDRTLTQPPSANEALSATGLQVLRRLNELLPPKHGERRNRLIAQVEQRCPGPKYAMSRQFFEDYDRAFEASNEWTRRKYFPHRASLFSSKIPEETVSSLSPAELDRVAAELAAGWVERRQSPPAQPTRRLKASGAPAPAAAGAPPAAG